MQTSCVGQEINGFDVAQIKEHDFNPGDVVYLASGSPKMTIIYANSTHATVLWFEDGKSKEYYLPLKGLKHAYLSSTTT